MRRLRDLFAICALAAMGVAVAISLTYVLGFVLHVFVRVFSAGWELL